MNTIDLEEVKNNEAVKRGYGSFNDALEIGIQSDINLIVNSVVKQCCDEQIKACSEKAINEGSVFSVSETSNVVKKPTT